MDDIQPKVKLSVQHKPEHRRNMRCLVTSDMAYKKGSVTKLTILPFPPVPYGTKLLSSQGLSLGPVLKLIALDSFDQRIRSIVAGIVPYFE